MIEIQEPSQIGTIAPLDVHVASWNQYVGMAVPRLSHSVGASLSHAAGVLMDMSQRPLDNNHLRLIDQTRQITLRDRGGIMTAFRLHFVQLLEGDPSDGIRFSDASTPSLSAGRYPSATQAPDIIAQTIRKVCQWELRGIEARFRDVVKPEKLHGLTNPFSPEFIGQALGAALEDQGIPLTQRNFLAPMLADPLAMEVRALYRDIMDLVTGKGVAPVPKRPAIRQPTDGIGGTGASRTGEVSLQPTNAPTGNQAPNKPLTVQDTIIALSKLQREQVPPPLGASESSNMLQQAALADFIVGTGNSGRITLDLIAALFESITSNKEISPAVKNQIGRLQIPLLKAALLDADVVRNQDHPARQFLHFLVESAKDPSQRNANISGLQNAVKVAVDSICEHYGEDPIIFATVLQDIQKNFTAFQPTAPQPQVKAETTADQKVSDADAASMRKTIGFHIQGSRLSKFTLTFLFDHWATVFKAVYTPPGKDAAPTLTEPSQAMSTLIRTLEPHNWRENRAVILPLLPTVLMRLKLGMQAANVSQAAQDSFLAGLAKCHALAMQVAKQIEPMVADKVTVTMPSQTPATTTMAITEPSSTADAVAKSKSDKHDALVRGLQRGALIEFRDQGGSMAWLKLAWISPNGSIFVFTNKQGKRALTINAAALAERFRRDEAQIALDTTVGDGSMGRLLGGRLQNVA